MAIKNLTDFQQAIGSAELPPPPPPRKYLQNDQPVSWGGPGSLAAGDAGSRLGINMGEPVDKAASLNFKLAHYTTDALVKEAFLARGALAGAKFLGKGLTRMFGGANAAGKASRGWFAARRAAQQPATTAMGKTMNAAGHAGDVADVGFAGSAVAAPFVGSLTYANNRSGGVL